jgi:uncharacterized protein
LHLHPAPTHTHTHTTNKPHQTNHTNSYLPGGFVVNNAHVDGAIVCLPELWLSWDAASPADATPESLSVLLDLAAPKPEVLVVGCGARMRPLPAALARALEERGIAVEALDTVRRW